MSDTVLDERLSIGGNNPPPDLKVGEALREELTDDHAAMVARKDALIAMADRFDTDHPTVDDDETSGILAGIITQINGHAKKADAVREGVKAPYLEGGRIIDGFFKAGVVSPCEQRAAKLNEKQTAYGRAKAEREKREALERERLAREDEDRRRNEAERAERERAAAERQARRAKDDEEAAGLARERARLADERAAKLRQEEEQARVRREEAAKIATSNAADRSRVRGDYAMVSLRTTWKFRVKDIKQVPAEFLVVNESMVNAAIRGKNGRREILGLEIYPVEAAVNR